MKHENRAPTGHGPEVDPGYAVLMERVVAAHREAVAKDNADDARWREVRRRVVDVAPLRRRTMMMWLVPIGLVSLAVALAVVGSTPEVPAPPHNDVAMLEQAVIGRVEGPSDTSSGPRVLTVIGGHRLDLHAGARVDIKVNDRSRFLVSVDAGVAHFEVVPRTAGQSFEVEVGTRRVVVRGTAFEVRRGVAGHSDTVKVLRGKVEIVDGHEVVALGAGETWSADVAPEPAEPVEPVDPVVAPFPDGSDGTIDVVDAVAPVEPPWTDTASADVGSDTPEVVSDTTPSQPQPNAPGRKKPATLPLEALDAGVEAALLASLRIGDCARANRAIGTIMNAHGAATPPEVVWMKAWCTRKAGDIATSRRLFDRVRGKVAWPVPADDTLPSVP